MIREHILLSETLKKLREKNNITQNELADKLCITRQAVSNWERGVSDPCLDDIKNIAAFYGVDYNELIDGQERWRPLKRLPWWWGSIVGEVISAVFTLGMMIALIVVYIKAPTQIPTHFNFAGEADAWGAKSNLLVMPAVALVFYVLISVIGRFPAALNIPVTINQYNERAVYKCVGILFPVTKIFFSSIMFSISICSMTINKVPGWLLLINVGGLIGTIVIFCIAIIIVAKKYSAPMPILVNKQINK